MGQIKFANNAVSRLVGPLTTSSASLTVTPGDGALFPALAAGDWYMATLIRADGAREIVKVTSRTVDAMSILRAQENTAALAFSPNDRIEARITSGAMDEFVRKGGDTMTGALAMGPKASSNCSLDFRLIADGNYTPTIRSYSVTKAIEFINGDYSAVNFSFNDNGDFTARGNIGTPSNNSYGKRTVSSAAPSGGVDGDIWYQV